MLTAVPLFTVIATAPPVDLEVTAGPESAHVLAYDESGEVSAELVMWPRQDHIEIAALFPDGLYFIATVRDGVVEVDSDDPAEAAERLDAVVELAQEGKWMCAAKLAIAAYECAGGAVILCPAGAYFAFCECGALFEGFNKKAVCDF